VKVLEVASALGANPARKDCLCDKNAKRLIEFPLRAFISMIFLAIPSI